MKVYARFNLYNTDHIFYRSVFIVFTSNCVRMRLRLRLRARVSVRARVLHVERRHDCLSRRVLHPRHHRANHNACPGHASSSSTLMTWLSGFRTLYGASSAASSYQGVTLVHFSAQREPFLTQNIC